jgi:GxxExxY protein
MERAQAGIKHAFDEDSHQVIGAAIEVHRQLGPGFREEVYERALQIELAKRRIRFNSQCEIIVYYEGVKVGEHVLDLIVRERIVVELKAVATLAEVHRDQLLGYLRAANLELGLLLNFGESPLGIKRLVNTYRG